MTTTHTLLRAWRRRRDVACVVWCSVRDPLLRQMVVARRQAYRQAVRDHQRRAEEARKAGKR